MGDTLLETRADEIEQKISSYRVLTYKASEIPLTYQNVVLARWLRSLKRLNEYFKLIDNNAYFNVYEKYIKTIISRPMAIARFAVLNDDHDIVLGWSITEGSALHFVHVQELNRKAGIGINLIPSDIKYITHTTRHWDKYLGKHFKVIFNPFI